MDIKHSNLMCLNKAYWQCSYFMCLNKAYWQCNCPGYPKSCDLHVQSHKIKKRCLIKNIKSLYLNAIARCCQNALNTLEFNSINLAQKIIKEVKNCLVENLNFISSEKQRIKILALSNNKSQVKAILNWVASINSIKRNPKAFTSSLSMLLGVDKNSIELLKAEENQYILNEKTKEDLQMSNNKIMKMEKEIASLKKENENEIEKNIDLTKNLAETEKKLEMLNTSMAATEKKLGKLNLNMQIAKKKLEEFKIILPSSEFKSKI
ncbi:hypothetical protein SteCoe_33505 [Stentor coeruleus]|uniref:Uncharacterized protein n=1 Tax=Stentor coeruleus TaxID=5963 RepID=A0A1R2AWL3_9CILI|nr:hypothetical protein SteCoe_33505 [Stentor coeruleus]